jgi:hypothetical protein
MVILQTQLVQYFTSLPNIIAILVEIGAIYLYFRESIINLNNKVKYLIAEVEGLKSLSLKVVSLESKIDLMSNDQKHLMQDFAKTEKSLDSINADVHKMKASLIGVEMYLKQLLDEK